MASARKRARWAGADDADTLRRMEGLLQELRDTKPENRPDQVTHVFLAHQFGVSATTMRSRLADAESRRSRSDDADYFCDLWYQIANVLGEYVAAQVYKTARDPGNRNCFTAAKWILERTDPETYGTGPARQAQHDASSVVADVPQEVWDELDSDENELLEQIEAAVASKLVELDALIRRVQKRVADRRANEGPSIDY